MYNTYVCVLWVSSAISFCTVFFSIKMLVDKEHPKYCFPYGILHFNSLGLGIHAWRITVVVLHLCATARYICSVCMIASVELIQKCHFSVVYGQDLHSCCWVIMCVTDSWERYIATLVMWICSSIDQHQSGASSQ